MKLMRQKLDFLRLDHLKGPAKNDPTPQHEMVRSISQFVINGCNQQLYLQRSNISKFLKFESGKL